MIPSMATYSVVHFGLGKPALDRFKLQSFNRKGFSRGPCLPRLRDDGVSDLGVRGLVRSLVVKMHAPRGSESLLTPFGQ